MTITELYTNQYWPIIDEHKESRPNGGVYGLYNESTKLTKIGLSYEIKNRLMSLRAQTGCQLTVIGIGITEVEIDVNISITEKFLHSYFAKYRVVGEWFNLRLAQRYELKNFLLDPDIFSEAFIDTNHELSKQLLF